MLSGVRSQTGAAAPPVVMPISTGGEPDLRGLGRLLWQKRDKILTVTLLAAAAAFVLVNVLTPRYRSEARLLLEARENVFLRADADKNVDRATIDAEAVASQIQVVLSRDLARAVIRKEHLDTNPEFDPATHPSLLTALLHLVGIGRDPSTMSKEERTLEAYYDHLSVFAVDKSRVIAVNFTSANPVLAASVANAIAETYLTMQQQATQNQTRAAGSWLGGEIKKLRAKVTSAEDKVEQYRAKANLFVGVNNSSLPAQQLSDLNAQIATARGRQADLEARAERLRTLIRSGAPIESFDVANSETMRGLIAQRIVLQSQLAEQSTALLPRHPRIIELKAQIAETNKQIRVEGERLARQLDNDARVAGDRIKTLTASLDQVKKAASQTNQQEVQLRALQREAKTDRALLESYLVKYREASARDSINAAPPEARIISGATPSIQPAFPKKVPMILIAAFAGFALSAGFIVTGALLAPLVASPFGYTPVTYMAPVAQRPVTPVMPQTASPPLAPDPPTFHPVHVAGAITENTADVASTQQFASAIEQMADELRLAGQGGRQVAVIGTQRNVGTTFAAVTLARVLAQRANVVLVDLAFEVPNLSAISVNPQAPGVAELIRGTASFADIIMHERFSPVHLIAAGNVGNDGPSLSTSPMVGSMIEALVRSYDYVLIDSGTVADAAVARIAPLTSLAVLVATDPADPSTQVAQSRLDAAGFAKVSVLAGHVPAAAA